MSVRENLLRLRRWRLQERQEYLAGLESLLVRLRGDARRLQEETAGLRPPGAGQAGLARPLIERQRKIERSVAEVEKQIDEARATVDAVVQEVKLCEAAMGPQAVAAPVRVTRRTRREHHGAFPGLPRRSERPRSV